MQGFWHLRHGGAFKGWRKRVSTLIVVVTLSLGFAGNVALFPPVNVHARELQARPELPSRLDSPRLIELAGKVKAGDRSAVRRFWAEVKGKTPLVEKIPEYDQLRRVTFLWRGGTEAHKIRFVGMVPPEARNKRLLRLANTDVWFLTLWLPATSRFTYGFERTEKYIADQLNPLKFEGQSLADLPGAPPQPWIHIQTGVPKGSLKHEKLRSEILQEERFVSVYTPAGYENGKGSYGLLILFDGEAYRGVIPTPTILDNLIAGKEINPLVAILVDSKSQESRDRELQCYAPFADFLAKELVPWAQQRYRLNPIPEQTIVGGSSYGGLSAAYSALRYPEVFGSVLSQSGEFGYFPGWENAEVDDISPFGWLIRQFVITPKLPIRFFVEVGLFETEYPANQLAQTRRMRDVLEAKGYPVVYSEFAGGHEYLNWRGSLAEGLIALAGREQ